MVAICCLHHRTVQRTRPQESPPSCPIKSANAASSSSLAPDTAFVGAAAGAATAALLREGGIRAVAASLSELSAASANGAPATALSGLAKGMANMSPTSSKPTAVSDGRWCGWVSRPPVALEMHGSPASVALWSRGHHENRMMAIALSSPARALARASMTRWAARCNESGECSPRRLCITRRAASASPASRKASQTRSEAIKSNASSSHSNMCVWSSMCRPAAPPSFSLQACTPKPRTGFAGSTPLAS
mmetsp:Transcript_95388/g.269709  ORF Transcript_95388/g.269709 Transcript_95388/m.269709 type:complete len:248 (-) Transcript_95388:2274-3017(-)